MEQENMIERIFNLVPIEYMIPYTEEWKIYDKKYELNYYNQIFRLEIPVMGATDYAYIYIYINKEYIYISTEDKWCRHCGEVNEKIPLQEAVVDIYQSKISFRYHCKICDIGEHRDRYCRNPSCGLNADDQCRLYNYDFHGKVAYINFVISFKFKREEFAEIIKNSRMQTNGICKTAKLGDLFPQNLERDEVSKTTPLQVPQKSPSNIEMINNIIKDMGIEFGICTDQRIKSTPLGTIVEFSKDRYLAYNRTTKELTNYNNLDSIINVPIVKMSVADVKEGELILHKNNKLYFVKNVENDFVSGINLETAAEEKIVPVNNPLGIKTYTKLIPLGEILGFKGNENQTQQLIIWGITKIMSKLYGKDLEEINTLISKYSSKIKEYASSLLPVVGIVFLISTLKGESSFESLKDQIQGYWYVIEDLIFDN